MQQLTNLYISLTGSQPASVESITGSGSNRQYVRFVSDNGESLIGVIGTSLEENQAFIKLARHFMAHGLPMPEVKAVSDDGMRYLQEDFGNRSLFDALRSGREQGGRYSDYEKGLLKRTIGVLPKIQLDGVQELDFSVCYPQASMDETNVLFDLNYFKYCFLKPSGVDFHELRLQLDFEAFARDLIIAKTDDPLEHGFVYRDFQARNVMLDTQDMPHFIDFQGGRRGPVYYDLASFLWQASALYPQSLRDELIKHYKVALGKMTDELGLGELHFSDARLRLFVFFRLLQVLGAYGYRGYFEHKQHFIDSIPPALDNLRTLFAEFDLSPYPELHAALESLLNAANLSSDNAVPQAAAVSSGSNLVVDVFSFSFKRGIPDDTSGNGGGYVFDCRGTNNPGRYEQYKQLTGLDEPVIRFLEDDGEILTFLDSIYKLADTHVERYIERGFTHLQFAFGCTGGQHRSVYSAQHLAEHLYNKFGIEVHVCHREQNITSVLKK